MNRRILRVLCTGFSAFAMLGFAQNAEAQLAANTYQFSAISGTYTEITGGTSIGNLMVDDAISAALNIGFTFNYCGTDYTQLKVSSNGWGTFNTAVTTTTWTNSTTDLATIKPALMPLFDDLAGWGTGAAASYLLSGTAPNQVLTIQFKNWNWRGSSGSAPHISFQIKLYESSNIIEYIYRPEAAASDGGGATIGIGDNFATPGYLVLNNSTAAPTVSSTTFTTSIVAKPASGQIYRFKPLPPIDLKMDTIIMNPAFCSNATAPVSVQVSNKGTATINNMLVNWSVNGVAQTPVNYSFPTPITNIVTAPNNTGLIPLGDVFFPDNTPLVIKAWVVAANGLPDAVNTNDTITGSRAASLTGVIVNITPRDTTICEGTTITLDAGTHPKNPIYIWSNASLTQTIPVSEAGIFSVKVQNTDGCFDYDTVTISTHPNPLVNSIAVVDNADGSYQFSPIGAQNITSYSWDFGDGTKEPPVGMNSGTPSTITHPYATADIDTVILTLSNDCGTITTSRIVKTSIPGQTGINGINGIQNAFSIFPNPSKSVVTISNDNNIKIGTVKVFNLLGQQVSSKENINASKMQLSTTNLATGIYNVVIDTDKGKIIKKLEVIH